MDKPEAPPNYPSHGKPARDDIVPPPCPGSTGRARASGANTARFSTAFTCARTARAAHCAFGGGSGAGRQFIGGGPSSITRPMSTRADQPPRSPLIPKQDLNVGNFISVFSSPVASTNSAPPYSRNSNDTIELSEARLARGIEEVAQVRLSSRFFRRGRVEVAP